MSKYAVAPLFVIRAAGVPFDHLERLGSAESAKLARELLVRQNAFAAGKAEVEKILRFRGHGLSEEQFRAWRKALRLHAVPESVANLPPVFVGYAAAAAELATAEKNLRATFERELESARRALFKAAHTCLPDYLVFAGPGAQELRATLAQWRADLSLPTRNARAGDRERHIFLYLQRVAAKNDTFSAFGPSAWGRIEQGETPRFEMRNSALVSHAYLERWTAHAVAHALNGDPAVRAEIAPRRDPNSASSDSLDERTLALLAECDGATPAFAVTEDLAELERLAALGLIRWEIEVPALEPNPLRTIVDDIRVWRDNAVRTSWLNSLQPLIGLADTLTAETDPDRRATVMAEARDRLAKLGYERRNSQRFLYAATNPIGEECSRRDSLVISSDLTDKLMRDIAPWVDLWRDTYAFVASRVAAGLLGLLKTAPTENGVVSLVAFLRHCAAQKMPLQHHGIVALATIAFQEVKNAVREQLASRADAPELQLTAEDCQVVRRKFEFPHFDEYTYPSADLQISAISADAIARGDYEWIVSELHPPVAMLHHCFYWHCPDETQLREAFASTTDGKPNFHFGFFAADFTSHTAVRIFDALPQQTFFVAAERSNPKWQSVRPADVEVFVDESSGDVGLRKIGSHEYLGSFARAWLIPLGFHPFNFGHAPHMPRLRCGNAIVQRRAWTVVTDEMRTPHETGVTSDLIVAIEELRAARGLPRYVYIRPTEQALRRSGAEGRDKDTKPVFIDLESYLSIEIFYRWLHKAGEIEVTEMLPDPDHLCWQNDDGRRTFELRTLIVPRR